MSEILWWDDVSEEAIVGLLDRAFALGIRSFWIERSNPERVEGNPILLGHRREPKGEDARHYVFIDGKGWVQA